MSNEAIIQALAKLLADVEYEKRHSVVERRDKLSAVAGHLQYAIQRMNAPL